VAARLAEENPRAAFLREPIWVIPANPLAHEAALPEPEIWEQMPARLVGRNCKWEWVLGGDADWFSGDFSIASSPRRGKSKWFWPTQKAPCFYEYVKSGKLKRSRQAGAVEGIGEDFIPENYRHVAGERKHSRSMTGKVLQQCVSCCVKRGIFGGFFLTGTLVAGALAFTAVNRRKPKRVRYLRG